jgi:hypothetical protein
MQREVECLQNLSCHDEALLPSRCWQITVFDGFSNEGAEKQRISIIPLGAADLRKRLYSLALTSLLFAATFQSELRVRHREETKNVTRLTMENVSFLVCNAV